MILNCVIVEDEKHAIELLTDHIESLPNLSLIKVFSKPVDAITDITDKDKIDVIFMDINMPGLSGIDLAKILRSKTRFLIFTTTHQQYALQAFEVEADQYILKPITFAKFVVAIDKIMKIIDKDQVEKTIKREVFIKTGVKNKLIKINPAEILYLESKDNYVLIHLPKESVIAYLTLKEAMEYFNYDNVLMQIHKSFVIAKHKVEKIEGNNIMMSNKINLPLGGSYKIPFFDYIKQNTVISGRSKSPSGYNETI